MKRGLINSVLGAGLLGVGALGWALVEAQAYVLRKYDVPVLPAGSSPVAILQISDLHMTPGDRRRIDWVKGLAATEPDVVITTGDNLAHVDAVPAVIEALTPFLTLPGAFVTGSNDYFLPHLKNPFKYFKVRDSVTPSSPSPDLPYEELLSGFQVGGWMNLDNARGQFTVRGTTIDLVGTGDAHISQDDYPPPAPSPSDSVRVGVTHAPYRRVLQQMVEDDVDIAIAGHTHGGQVCVPGYGALVTNCDLENSMASGLHRWPTSGSDSMWLHVSAGLGTSPFTPIRFACRPEASLITLTPRAK